MLSKLARMKGTKDIQGQEVVISFNGDDVGEHARDVAIQSTPMQMYPGVQIKKKNRRFDFKVVNRIRKGISHTRA